MLLVNNCSCTNLGIFQFHHALLTMLKLINHEIWSVLTTIKFNSSHQKSKETDKMKFHMYVRRSCNKMQKTCQRVVVHTNSKTVASIARIIYKNKNERFEVNRIWLASYLKSNCHYKKSKHNYYMNIFIVFVVFFLVLLDDHVWPYFSKIISGKDRIFTITYS